MGCPAPPMAIMTHPGTCSGHPVAIPETSQGSPKALLGLKKRPRTGDEPAVTKHIYIYIYISAGPLVGHTAVSMLSVASIKCISSSIKYKYMYEVSGIKCQVSSIRWLVSSIKSQVSSVKYQVYCIWGRGPCTLLKGSRPGAKTPQ